MEPTTNNNESNSVATPPQEINYHTISGGPETLHELAEKKNAEMVIPTVEVNQIQSLIDNQQQFTPPLNNTTAPQYSNTSDTSYDFILVIRTILLFIIIYPLLGLFLVLPLKQAFGSTLGTNYFLSTVFFLISPVTTTVLCYFFIKNDRKKHLEMKARVIEKIQISPSRKQDDFVVRMSYIVFILTSITCIVLYLKTQSSILVYLVITVYIIFLLILLMISIKNILEKKEYYMLGHFFIFLVSPLFIGFGLCTVGALLISSLSAFSGILR